MSTHKWIDRICVAVILLTLAVTMLFMNGERIGIAVVVDEDAEGYEASAWFTDNDLNADWDTSEATAITLSGDSAAIRGNGAYWLNGSLIIAQSGQYVISGELTDGNIVVDAQDYSKVWIRLDGVDVTCSDDACLRVNQADKVFVTLSEGTANTLTGAAEYSEEAVADGTNAVIYSHDDLTINGSGSLTVIASCLNGITSKDDLIITGGIISVTAPAHGIKVNDRFRFTGADFMITAGQDGIHSDKEFLMESGSIEITAEDDGVHADSLVQIYGGSLQITDCYEGIEAVVIEQYAGDVTVNARDDGLNANGYTGNAFGGMGMRETETQTEEQTVVSADETYVLIAGGTLTITNTSGMDADGIDSNGNLIITGGTIRVNMVNNGGNSALDCGTESGGQALISGGNVIATGNDSMAESFDSTSSQCSILYNISAGVSAGTPVSLYDADGTLLLSEEIPYDFSSIILSCSEMTVGETYRIVIGDSEEEIALSETSAAYGDASSQMFMGTMNHGGMRRMERDAEGTEGMTPPDFSEGGEGMTPPSLPEGMEGMTPPSFPEGMEGMTPPPLPEGMEGMTPPSFPEGMEGMTPPSFPEGGEGMMQTSASENGEGETQTTEAETGENGTESSGTEEEMQDPSQALPSQMREGAMPASQAGQEQGESPDNDSVMTENTVATQTDLPTDSGTFPAQNMGFPQGGGMQHDPGERGRENTRTQETEAEVQQEAGIGAEEWILVAVSAFVLLAGIVVAMVWRRSQHIDT